MRTPRIVTAIAAAAGMVTLATVGGCGALAERRLDFSHTENVKITEIRMEPGSGDVVVRTRPVSDVQIKRVVRYHDNNEPGETYRIEGTTLLIDTDCGRRCGVSYEIIAPQGVAVRGANGSGDVTLTEVAEVDIKVGSGSISVSRASSVRTETGSGEITIADVSGAVWAHAGSGSIEGRDLGGGKVEAETGSGDITLELGTVASVQATASSGSVNLTVPTGSYRVKTEAGSGSTNVTVAEDPAATALLDVRTGSGDITVSQR